MGGRDCHGTHSEVWAILWTWLSSSTFMWYQGSNSGWQAREVCAITHQRFRWPQGFRCPYLHWTIIFRVYINFKIVAVTMQHTIHCIDYLPLKRILIAYNYIQHTNNLYSFIYKRRKSWLYRKNSNELYILLYVTNCLFSLF